MVSKRRSFNRPLGNRRYKKIFIVAVEGSKTEPQYFSILNGISSVVKVLKFAHSSPLHVLQGMKNYIKKMPLLKTDQAWLVMDKDQWTDQQLGQLFAWSKESDCYGFAVSNPSFEYWLLLHFEDGNEIGSKRDCLNRLKRYLPHYEKQLEQYLITIVMVNKAIKRAELRDKPPCIDWPRSSGNTTVYRLIERILSSK